MSGKKEEKTPKKKSVIQIFEGMRNEISGLTRAFWFAGWLFTIAFAGVKGWSLLWALVIWPYYLGSALKVIPGP